MRSRWAPIALAATVSLVYVLVRPPSLDLAAHLLRARLFGAEGFGLWNNWWYGGHHVLGYSVLFPPLARLLTPQVVGTLACVGTAAAFDALVRDRYGESAWLGSLWFAAATTVDLFTGRLAFAFGLLPAVCAALALERRRTALATGLGVLTALASPVAALFVALAAGADALAPVATRALPDLRRLARGAAVAAGALVPVAVLAAAFPEGGSEPFAFDSLWPVLVICVVVLAAAPGRERALRAGALLYLLGTLAAYLILSPVGGNAVRLAGLAAGPLAAILWARRHPRWLIAAALPLLYLQWQPAVRDVVNAADDPSEHAAYWQALLAFLHRQPGGAAPGFRVEIPFTKFHTEAYRVAPSFPLARGWERQLDIADNGLFYGGRLDAASYRAWLDRLAVHFVAVSDAPLDYSARREAALVGGRLPYLRQVWRDRHWRVYAVQDPAPLLTGGGASITRLGPNSVDLSVAQSGSHLLRVRFTPYWRLSGVAGCVGRSAGGFTTLTLRGRGRARLVIAFSLSRVGARSPRCSGASGGG